MGKCLCGVIVAILAATASSLSTGLPRVRFRNRTARRVKPLNVDIAEPHVVLPGMEYSLEHEERKPEILQELLDIWKWRRRSRSTRGRS